MSQNSTDEEPDGGMVLIPAGRSKEERKEDFAVEMRDAPREQSLADHLRSLF